MYHPNSLYGRLQAQLVGTTCICNKQKQSNKPFCSNCFSNFINSNIPKVLRDILVYGNFNSEEFLDAYNEAIEELGYKV